MVGVQEDMHHRPVRGECEHSIAKNQELFTSASLQNIAIFSENSSKEFE
jgi:hypothetical protein